VTCDQRRDFLLLYAIDALEAAEAQEMREHLQTGCPACAGYLSEAQSLMATIPAGLEPVAPPAHLKAKLMARIDNDLPADSLPIRLFRYLVPTAIAAGLAIVCTHAWMNQRIHDLQNQAHVLEGEASASKMLAVSQAQQLQLLIGKFQSQTQVVEMLRSPGLKLVRMQPTALQPNAVANLLWDQNKQQWAILTTGMKPASAGETYELWYVTEAGAKIAAGTFDIDQNGTGSLRVNIPAGIGALKLAAVTNEKAGGVDQPHGNFQVTASVE
jgi:hypothetical protein